MRKLYVEAWEISRIKPYEKNAKKHPPEQIEQIKQSIEQFGFNDPIAVYPDGEIAEGHGRYLAAVALGFEALPVIVLDGLTEDEQRAYRLVHNHLTTDTGFDIDILNAELADILNIDMTQYGFAADIEERDFSDFFEASDKTKEPEKVQCPVCGEWFEV